MKAIKLLIGNNLDVSFDFYTYHFEVGKVYSVSDLLYDHLKTNMGLTFDFDIQETKKPLLQVKREKTKSFIKPTQPVTDQDKSYQSDMVIKPPKVNATFGTNDNTLMPDITPPGGTIDGDGVEWYEEGLQEDKL
jgi:hypothetical protein